MLQEFLDAQLLPITDENYFGKLQKVAESLAKTLQKDKRKILAYTLIVIDPEISIDNPDVKEVKELLTKEWNTFLTNCKDSPITFIRAVMLEALKTISTDVNNGCLIWLTSRNIYKHYNLIGKEQELISIFLLSLGKQMEKNAINSWTLPTESKLSKLSIEIKEITAVTIDRVTLQKMFVWASGPHDKEGNTPFAEPNPYWSNSGGNWSYAFAPKAAQAIAQEVNKTLKLQSKELTANQTQIQEVVNKFLAQMQSEFSQKNGLLQMQTQLLWWKESCYSPSIEDSYRGRLEGFLQLLIAHDYSTLVPHIYPKSVEYFLKETLSGILKDERKKNNLFEILKLITESREEAKNLFPEPVAELGRTSLLAFIKGLVWNKYKLEEFKQYVGFSPDIEISLADLAVWLFNDFQSLKVIKLK